MKNFFYFLLTVLFSTTTIKDAKAQIFPTVDVFCEDFEAPQSQWRMRTYSEGSSIQNPLWEEERVLTATANSTGSATDTCGRRANSFLETEPFEVDNFLFYTLSFYQIAYISAFDDGAVEYSFGDTTATGDTIWIRLPRSSYTGTTNYLGNPPSTPLRFNKLSAGSEAFWGLVFDTLLTPSSLADTWRMESFNLSSIIEANRTPGPDSMRIRFQYEDNLSSPVGRVGTHRWYIDDVCIRGSDCDTERPELTLTDPPNNYVQRFEERVYLIGPYEFDAQITDNQGELSSVQLIYFVKRDLGNGHVEIFRDSLDMLDLGASNFQSEIPIALSGGDVIEPLDSVFWKIEAFDMCANGTFEPPSGMFEEFQVRPNLPPSCGVQPEFVFPYFEDFNSGDFASGVPREVRNDANTDVSDEGWQNVSGDFHNWTINSGTSSNTGDFRIFNDFPGGGNYLYVESSRPEGGSFQDSVAFLLTPCFDLTEIPNGLVRFYLNMNTAGIEDTIRVDGFDPTPSPEFPDGRFINNIIPPITGNRGNNWLPFEFSTAQFNGTVAQFRFVGTPGRADGLSDMALDSFSIIPIPEIDVRLNAINIAPFVPTDSTNGFEDNLSVNVQNLGTTPINRYDIQYQIFSQEGELLFTSTPETHTATIGPGENMDLELNNTYMPPLGIYGVRAWVNFAGDTRPLNDTTFSNSRGLRYNDARIYTDNFDGANDWVTFLEANIFENQWELGTPNFDFTNTAYTPPNSWDILLNRPYTGTGRIATLFTPFMDFSSSNDAIMSFIGNRDINEREDGVFIEYSLDRGLTWDSLTSGQDPDRLEWYNSFLGSGGLGGTRVFAGNSFCDGAAPSWAGGYRESELRLPSSLLGETEVLFRFNFFAQLDENGNDGMSIDNFLLYDPQSLDLQAQHYFSPNSDCALNDQQRVEIVVKNRGLNTVSNFDVEFRAIHLPTGNMQSVTDNYTRTIAHRDTIHIRSISALDLSMLGDYVIETIVKLPNDEYVENDTLRADVENIDGCFMLFRIETTDKPNGQIPCDSSVWRFDYTSEGRDYEVSGAYNSERTPINLRGVNQLIETQVCIRKNAQVRFELNDEDTLISNYSLIAFNGENDSIFANELTGGPDAQPLQFFWECPPDLSAAPVAIRYDNDIVQLPTAKEYSIEVDIQNNGLDSLEDVTIVLQIDDSPPPYNAIVDFDFVPNLRYNRRRNRINLGSHFLDPGRHTVRVWTTQPNGQQDQFLADDTLVSTITIMDTMRLNPITRIHCEGFESDTSEIWVAANPFTLGQEMVSLEQGVPNGAVLNTANTGSNVWATNLDGDYPNSEANTLISPFFLLEQDSCYQVSFNHNYYITDSLNDGFTMQILDRAYLDRDEYDNSDWDLIGNNLGDTVSPTQRGWYNTQHVLAISDNSQNSGWTGISRGWKSAQNSLIANREEDFYTAFRWRFESDGDETSEGWAFDDFCIETIDPAICLTVGLPETAINEDELYLGQNIPNPAGYQTSIPYYVPNSGVMVFTVVNLLGQPVFELQRNLPKGDGIIELDLSSFSEGIYYYSMTINGVRLTKKMIVAK